MERLRAISFGQGRPIELLDQTELPSAEVYRQVGTVAELREAIQSLRVRGAPLLGVTAAAGMALAAETLGTTDAALRAACDEIAGARPTAVELQSMAHRALRAALAVAPDGRVAALWAFAQALAEAREAEDDALARHGAALFGPGTTILTHCNTGTLATGALGTALGVVAQVHADGNLARCFADETRPLLQGARLTMWELQRRGIPATLLPDGAAASLLATGQVTAVITGADRIAMNGDAANKVGTAGLAILAQHFGVPLYIAAPLTTFDPATPSGVAIPIEQRAASEVTGYRGLEWAPAGSHVYNPAFDVTGAGLITAFITERGLLRPPFGRSVAGTLGSASPILGVD
ncbi:MAG: S-methyl-5-thioribose-1-phosphate isomerase [Dehalococcoidia bacterium]